MSAAIELRTRVDDAAALAVDGWITFDVLARALEKKYARAARDWCQVRGVPYRRDGKVNWVRLEDVRRYIDGCPLAGPPPARSVPPVQQWGGRR